MCICNLQGRRDVASCFISDLDFSFHIDTEHICQNDSCLMFMSKVVKGGCELRCLSLQLWSHLLFGGDKIVCVYSAYSNKRLVKILWHLVVFKPLKCCSRCLFLFVLLLW